ncbi:MAG: lysylphosphatidylglycerol synthase domain-containing protein [Oscillatoria sp. PMC 1051.18]|nr:lysylphosphatidylglycerol synthase domain-containing protein [Oscillatoria sp. PMC 1050.18]MEC5031542.1 lysylphosphatidylglycerol synthase domain-containing protein [Oscillatoria sp. PMC 1051.18]
MKKKHLSYLGTVLFSVLLLSLCGWVISRELKAYNYQDIANSLANLPRSRLLFSVLLAALGYGIMTISDALAVRYVRHPLPWYKTTLAALTSVTISNSLGFALVTGSAIRYRLYSAWGLSQVAIAQVIAYGNLSFWVGMCAVGGVLFVTQPLPIPAILNLPFASMQIVGGIFLSLAIAYLILSILTHNRALRIKNHLFRVPSLRLSVAQITISGLDWAIATGVLYTLLIPSGLSFPAFFSIYLLAQLSGIISHIPGGLGIFETVIVLLLQPQVKPDTAIASLLAYRAVYYLLPLSIGLVLLAGYELRDRLRK